MQDEGVRLVLEEVDQHHSIMLATIKCEAPHPLPRVIVPAIVRVKGTTNHPVIPSQKGAERASSTAKCNIRRLQFASESDDFHRLGSG